MKLIIAGTRTFDNADDLVLGAIRQFHIMGITEVVSGMASGVDVAGIAFAKSYGVSVQKFPADWSLGKSAGPRRNRDMAMYADELLLIWDGQSKGSANMKNEMMRLKKPVYEVILRKP